MNKHKLHFLVDMLAYLALVSLAATGLLLAYRLPPGSGAATMLGLTRHEWGDVHFWIAIAFMALAAFHVVLHWRWVTNTFGALLAARAQRRPGAGRGGTIALLALGLVTVGLLAAPWFLGNQGAESGRSRGHGCGAGQCSECEDATEAMSKPTAPSAEADAANPDPSAKEPRAGKGSGGGQGAGAGRGGAGQGAGVRGNEIRGNTTLADAAASHGVPLGRLIAELGLPPNTPGTARLGQVRHEHGFTMEDVRRALARLAESK